MRMIKVPIVMLKPGDISVKTERGSTILQVIQRAGIPLASICGGRGVCGKCRVVVVSGGENLNYLTNAEMRLLSPRDIEKEVRLACQAKIAGDYVSIYIPEESLIVSRGRAIAPVTLRDDIFPLNPVVKKIHVKLPRPTLEDNRADFERLREALVKQGVKQDLVIPLEVLRELPFILRANNWDVTVVLYENELISVEPGDTTNKLYGVAVDIGTSKIIVHLVDLNSGVTLAEDSLENPQLTYGADVISRIMYAEKSQENLIKLQQLVVSAINRIIRDLAERAKIDQRNIYEVVVVGNTVMHHLFFGIQPSFIARSPYVPAISRSFKCKSREIGVDINSQGYVYSHPVIRAYVGADGVADILATQMYKLDELVLTIDIGTNTEVFLGNSEIILAASAPAGPAFEGVGITYGMRAVPGAIGSIRINNSDVEYETIGGVKPRGICGTGLIDLVAELHRNRIIDDLGRFTAVNHPRVHIEGGLRRFIVVPAEESATGAEIYVTLRDIETILLAIAAIKAAWTMLSRKLGVSPLDIKRIYVAGSFGARLNVDSAVEVGLLPPISKERIIFVGESAIVGAKIALKSSEARREIGDVVEKKIKYIELSADPEFRDVYVKSMRIGNKS
jgi:uncharacterized 2Fe-2S/4Fe-4S cluster protein (DUF4445 family)